jgi:hypothetical protein
LQVLHACLLLGEQARAHPGKTLENLSQSKQNQMDHRTAHCRHDSKILSTRGFHFLKNSAIIVPKTGEKNEGEAILEMMFWTVEQTFLF